MVLYAVKIKVALDSRFNSMYIDIVTTGVNSMSNKVEARVVRNATMKCGTLIELVSYQGLYRIALNGVMRYAEYQSITEAAYDFLEHVDQNSDICAGVKQYDENQARLRESIAFTVGTER